MKEEKQFLPFGLFFPFLFLFLAFFLLQPGRAALQYLTGLVVFYLIIATLNLIYL